MTPPSDDASPLEIDGGAEPAEELFVQLLTAWDERLADGKSAAATADEAPVMVDGMRHRLAKAQDCLNLLNQIWPAPRSPRGTQAEGRAYARFGRYEIIRELGRGGHGVVFLAADRTIKRHVALKFPRPDVLVSDELRMRFLREAEATARLDHPNILPVFEVGCEGPICFTAAAYCDGGTLQEWFARRKSPLSPREAARIIGELAAAIHHAHTRGVLHRDLKPSNVLLAARNGEPGSGERSPSRAPDTSPGSSTVPAPDQPAEPPLPLFDHWTVKIADFGLAKVADSTHETTVQGIVMGTLNYMAPEQAEGRTSDVGVTADVYSLGVMLYELLTGAPPFLAPSHLSGLGRAEADQSAWPSAIRRRIPADLRTICLTCLAKDPARRYQSAAALATDLQRFVRGEAVTARPLSPLERLRRTLVKHPALALLSIAAACLAVGFVVQLYWHNRELREKNAELAKAVERERRHVRDTEELRRVANERAEENRRRSLGSRLRVAQQFGDAGSLRQLTEALHETFPQPGEDDLREFAWRYWWHRCRRGEFFRLPGHGQFVHDAAFSPDGSLIATASADGTVRVWDYQTGREVMKLYGMDGEVNKVVFSYDGKLLAAAGYEGQVRTWDTAEWKPQAAFEKHIGQINGLVFDGENRLLTGGTDGWIYIWDPRTAEMIDSVRLTNNRYVESFAIAPASKLLFIGMHNGEIQLRSTTNIAKPIQILKRHPENVRRLAVSQQEDRLCSVDARGDVGLWDLSSRGPLSSIEDGSIYTNTPVAISPDGKWLAIVAKGGRSQLLDMATRKVKHEKTLDVDSVGALAFSRDGTAILAAGRDGQVVLWQPFEDRPSQPEGHAKEAWSVAFAPNDGTFFTGDDEGIVKRWRTTDGQLVGDVLRQPGTVSTIAVSSKGTLLATGSLEELESEPANVRVWKLPEGELLHSLKGHSNKVYAAAFHPHADVLATGAREVILWNAKDGTLIKKLVESQKINKKIRALAFSPDGSMLACGSEDGNVYLYDYRSLNLLKILTSGGQVWSLDFSPDGQRLAAGNWDGSVTVWCPQTFTVCLTLKGHLQGIHGVAYSHDGNSIATASSDTTIKLWGPKTGQELCTLQGHDHEVFALAFAPDDQCLASCSYDGKVKLWRAPRTPTLDAALRANRPAETP